VGSPFAWRESCSRGVGGANNLVLAAGSNEKRAAGFNTYDHHRLSGICLRYKLFFGGSFEIVGALPGSIGHCGEEILIVIAVEDEPYSSVSLSA